MERVLREVAERDEPAVIFGDAFGNEEAVRRVAAEYPQIAFVFGRRRSGRTELLGVRPGSTSRRTSPGCWRRPDEVERARCRRRLPGTGGQPYRQRLHRGRKEVNPDVEVKVTFLNSWFDPAAAKEAALAQVGAGADVLFAERFGVIEAASENDLLAIGNMSDQKELAPQHVVSSVTWNMTPTVGYVIDQVMAGAYTAQDLKDFSMVAKGGAALAAVNDAVTGGVPADLSTKVQDKEAAIKSGTFRVDINEATPPGATVPAG